MASGRQGDVAGRSAAANLYRYSVSSSNGTAILNG